MLLPVLELSVKHRGLLSLCKVSRLGPCCVKHESVRNYSKPRWIPIAKSKMFTVMEERGVLPKLEHEEHKVMQANYDLYTRSLWAHEANRNREREVQKEKDAIQVSEEVELERIIKFNDEENEKVRKIREAALVEEHKQIKEEILQMKKQKEEEELAHLEQTEKEVNLQLERLKGAIKFEDLDDVIAKALAVEIDYNFAVTKDGKYLVGRNNRTETADLITPPSDPIIKSEGASS